MTHTVYFIPKGAKSKKDWRVQVDAQATSCTGQTCTVPLPKAKDEGSFKLECRDCPAWALVTVTGRRDDPVEFTMPCGRIRMRAELDAESGVKG